MVAVRSLRRFFDHVASQILPNYHTRQNLNFPSSSIINPILIRVYPRKWGWPGLPHSNSNLSNAHSPSHSIHGILLLQTNTLALLLHLHLSTFSLVVLASSCPSLQTPALFSKHAHHPSSTHARTISSIIVLSELYKIGDVIWE